MVLTRDGGLQEVHEVAAKKGAYFSGDPQSLLSILKGVVNPRSGSLLSGRPQEGTSKVSSISKDSRRLKFSDAKILQSQESKTQWCCMSVTDIISKRLPCFNLTSKSTPFLQIDPRFYSSLSLQLHWPPCSQNILSLFLPQGLCTCCALGQDCRLPLLTVPTPSSSYSSGFGSNATSSERPSMNPPIILQPYTTR